MKILTAADSHYFLALWQFLRSLRRKGLMKKHPVVVYDLGLTLEQNQKIGAAFGIKTVTFDFDSYPDHFRNLIYCAWKPVIINRELDGPTLWLDAATIVKQGLGPIERFIREKGFYTLTGQSEIRDWCHPTTLESMDVPVEHMDRQIRIAGVLGLDGDSSEIRNLVGEWQELALDSEIIAPVGASRANHRYDQSLLNNLLQRYVDRGAISLAVAGDVDISAVRPIRQLTTRNQVPDWLPIPLLPVSERWNDLYKRLDRLALRMEHFYHIRLGGLSRISKERFHLHLRFPDGERDVQPPRGKYWADPFLIDYQGSHWLFFEEYESRTDKGRICAILTECEEDVRVVLDERWHFSFPYLYQAEDGRLFMLPESSAHGTLDLYLCDQFPDRWYLHRRLMYGVDIADTVLFFHDGLYWLMGGLRDLGGDSGRYLALFYAEQPDSSHWTPHPINGERLYQNRPNQGGRNAGAPFRSEGKWIRPMQHNPDYYGQYLQFQSIEELTPENFQEQPWTPTDGDMPHLSHHYHRCGDWEVWDVRDRVDRMGLLIGGLKGA